MFGKSFITISFHSDGCRDPLGRLCCISPGKHTQHSQHTQHCFVCRWSHVWALFQEELVALSKQGPKSRHLCGVDAQQTRTEHDLGKQAVARCRCAPGTALSCSRDQSRQSISSAGAMERTCAFLCVPSPGQREVQHRQHPALPPLVGETSVLLQASLGVTGLSLLLGVEELLDSHKLLTFLVLNSIRAQRDPHCTLLPKTRCSFRREYPQCSSSTRDKS